MDCLFTIFQFIKSESRMPQPSLNLDGKYDFCDDVYYLLTPHPLSCKLSQEIET